MTIKNKKIALLITVVIAAVWVIETTILVNAGVVQRELMMWISPIGFLLISLVGTYQFLNMRKSPKFIVIKTILLSVTISFFYFFAFLILTLNSPTY